MFEIITSFFLLLLDLSFFFEIEYNRKLSQRELFTAVKINWCKIVG